MCWGAGLGVMPASVFFSACLTFPLVASVLDGPLFVDVDGWSPVSVIGPRNPLGGCFLRAGDAAPFDPPAPAALPLDGGASAPCAAAGSFADPMILRPPAEIDLTGGRVARFDDGLTSGAAAADMPKASLERAAARRTREAEDDTLPMFERTSERAKRTNLSMRADRN